MFSINLVFSAFLGHFECFLYPSAKDLISSATCCTLLEIIYFPSFFIGKFKLVQPLTQLRIIVDSILPILSGTSTAMEFHFYPKSIKVIGGVLLRFTSSEQETHHLKQKT